MPSATAAAKPPQKLAEKPKLVRGPHAERTAAMQQRLIDTAIQCLYELGYAATTTQLVMDRAGVSRGALLHHFPTKVDLMVAVANFAARFQNRTVRTYLAQVPEGMPMYLALTKATWEVNIQPPATALLEIMMAARADAALAERLSKVVETFENQQREDVWRMAESLGITDQAAVEAMIRLHRAAMRGLAIELNLQKNRAAVDASVDILESYKRFLTGKLLTGEDL